MKRTTKLLLPLLCLFAVRSHGQQVVRATDVNLVTTAGTKLVLDGGITFKGTSLFLSTADSVYLYTNTATSADWLDSTAAGALDPASTGNTFMNGNIRQQFYGKTRFNNLFIRNTNGDTLLSSCEVRNVLNLDTGYVYTKTGLWNDSLLVSNPAVAAIVSSSNFGKSWVDGRLSRTANVQTTITAPPIAPYYLFPVGKTDSLYAPVKMAKINNNTTTWTMEYFNGLPFDYLNVQNPPVDHISRMEYWEITSNSAAGPDDDAYVSLSWRGHSKVSSIAGVRDSLMVAEYIIVPGIKWAVPGGWATGRAIGPDSLSGYVTSNTGSYLFDTTSRRFTLSTLNKYNALPVNLVYFTAIGDGNKVRLNWEAQNEQDTRTYEIQRSFTAAGFSFLASVPALQLSQSQYTNYDYTPAPGWNYYRLKIYDKTGSFTYSPVRAVWFSKGLEEVKIFPNPATDLVHILLPSSFINTTTLQVYSIDGKFISSMKPNASTVQLNVMRLPAGTYLLRLVKDDGSTATYRFVKQ